MMGIAKSAERCRQCGWRWPYSFRFMYSCLQEQSPLQRQPRWIHYAVLDDGVWLLFCIIRFLVLAKARGMTNFCLYEQDATTRHGGRLRSGGHCPVKGALLFKKALFSGHKTSDLFLQKPAPSASRSRQQPANSNSNLIAINAIHPIVQALFVRWS